MARKLTPRELRARQQQQDRPEQSAQRTLRLPVWATVLAVIVVLITGTTVGIMIRPRGAQSERPPQTVEEESAAPATGERNSTQRRDDSQARRPRQPPKSSQRDTRPPIKQKQWATIAQHYGGASRGNYKTEPFTARAPWRVTYTCKQKNYSGTDRPDGFSFLMRAVPPGIDRASSSVPGAEYCNGFPTAGVLVVRADKYLAAMLCGMQVLRLSSEEEEEPTQHQLMTWGLISDLPSGSCHTETQTKSGTFHIEIMHTNVEWRIWIEQEREVVAKQKTP
jgi:hypothetical protein